MNMAFARPGSCKDARKAGMHYLKKLSWNVQMIPMIHLIYEERVQHMDSA